MTTAYQVQLAREAAVAAFVEGMRYSAAHGGGFSLDPPTDAQMFQRAIETAVWMNDEGHFPRLTKLAKRVGWTRERGIPSADPKRPWAGR